MNETNATLAGENRKITVLVTLGDYISPLGALKNDIWTCIIIY